MKTKKVTLVFLSILMFFCITGIFSLTAKAETTEQFTYYVNNEGLAFVTGYKGSESSITIPSQIDGKKVIGIAESAFEYNKTLKNITIPDSITSIGESAFLCCTGLESITLPKNLKVISKSMLESCINLKNITIFSNIKEIGKYAFAYDKKLDYVDYKGTVAQWRKINIKVDKENEESCKRLKMAEIRCTNGKIEYVKPIVLSLRRTGFQFVEIGWKKVTNASGYEVQLATDKNFTQNKKTVKVNKSKSKVFIKGLKSGKKYYIRGRAYKDKNSYSDWNLESDFGTNYKLVSKKSNQKVSRDYEYSVSKKNTVTIMAYIGSKTKLTIPSKIGGKKVTKIDGYAFRRCEDLKSVKISKGVTSIGEFAFYDCTNLSSISIPKGVTEIGVCAIDNTKYINNKKNWKNGALYISNYLISTKGLKGKYGVKKGTTLIAERAFEEERKLTNITIPSSVVSIGENAFLNCYKLKEITIPKNVKYLGENLFTNCDKLQSVKLPNGMKKIPVGMFMECRSLKNITLPKGVTEIGDWAFSGCSKLKTLTIPKSVKKIGQGSLSSSTTRINYQGTKKQWKVIKIDSDTLEYLNLSVHCTNGVIKLKAK